MVTNLVFYSQHVFRENKEKHNKSERAYLDVERGLIELYKFIYATIKRLPLFSVLASWEFKRTSIEAPIHFFNPLLFASCTDTFSKWCKITRGIKRSAQ
jgi:hypothetical protein